MMKNSLVLTFVCAFFGIVLLTACTFVQLSGDFMDLLMQALIYFFFGFFLGLYLIVGLIIRSPKLERLFLSKANLAVSAASVVALFAVPFGRLLLNDWLFAAVAAVICWAIITLQCFLISRYYRIG